METWLEKISQRKRHCIMKSYRMDGCDGDFSGMKSNTRKGGDMGKRLKRLLQQDEEQDRRRGGGHRRPLRSLDLIPKAVGMRQSSKQRVLSDEGRT